MFLLTEVFLSGMGVTGGCGGGKDGWVGGGGGGEGAGVGFAFVHISVSFSSVESGRLFGRCPADNLGREAGGGPTAARSARKHCTPHFRKPRPIYPTRCFLH